MGINFTDKTTLTDFVSANTIHPTNSYGILRGVADGLHLKEMPLNDGGVCRLGLSVSDHTILSKEFLERSWPTPNLNANFWPAALRLTQVPEIERVIHNKPATIVFWKDGTKTVVKADQEEYDGEKGIAMAFMKKTMGNKGNYFNEVKKWVR